MTYDIIVVGGGPAGLSFTRSLAGKNLRIGIVERQSRQALETPNFDGREIALTHHSIALLNRLGAWDRIDPDDIAPLRRARVLNGRSRFALRFDPDGVGGDRLGVLVSNHAIRRSLFETVATQPDVTIITDASVKTVSTDNTGATVTLDDGSTHHARLVVAADTRFSETRRHMGISAEMQDFGKVMLVCRMAHERQHDGIATEWFGYGQTMAMLPLHGNVSSAVVTLPAREMNLLMALPQAQFNAEITRRYRNRLGAMTLASTRHTYPLVGVYAQRFTMKRFALIGDAAVGMHPVTAHGFNLGLRGAYALADEICAAVKLGHDPADPAALRRYALGHHRAARPLYLATNATARFYTDDRLPVRVLRGAVLRIGQALPPMRHMVVGHLMDMPAMGKIA
ncbi:5-demethoxyubiquinol-8 5-hydroxylase UbiM [Acidiphilium sp.]|uniref:5-demethoxyubiquinol-8 5-hydroxylase UbiM n=1 Tax=Acidiphilium sp. TaxID=527 RepID=UPI003D06E69E